MQLPDINLDAIADPAARQIIGQLLNVIETRVAKNAALRAEIQQLRDENARLKGGSGKPQIPPPTPPTSTDHSSETEHQTRTPHGKPRKNQHLVVTHAQRCVIDPARHRDAISQTQTLVPHAARQPSPPGTALLGFISLQQSVKTQPATDQSTTIHRSSSMLEGNLSSKSPVG